MIIFTSGISVVGDTCTVHYEEKCNRKEIHLHYISYRISYRGNDGFELVEKLKNILNCGLQRKGKFRRPAERLVKQRKL
jgi:hypothetical protein